MQSLEGEDEISQARATGPLRFNGTGKSFRVGKARRQMSIPGGTVQAVDGDLSEVAYTENAPV